MEDISKYCTLFDIIQTHNPKVGKMLTDCCMSGAIMRKSFILLPDKNMSEIGNMSKTKMREALMDLIISKPPYEISKIKKLKDKDIKTIRGSTYTVTVDKDKVMLNGVEITQKKVIGKPPKLHTLLIAKSALKCTPPADKGTSKSKIKRVKVLSSRTKIKKGGSKKPSGQRQMNKISKIIF